VPHNRAEPERSQAGWRATRRPIETRRAARRSSSSRGFTLRTAEEFDSSSLRSRWSIRGLTKTPVETPAHQPDAARLTAKEEPSTSRLLHHERRRPIYPASCSSSARSRRRGGAPRSAVGRVGDRLAERCPDFARDCSREGAAYSNVMPRRMNPRLLGEGRSWQSTLRARREGAPNGS